MACDFELTALLSATPQQVYDAWLSSEGHTAMTGGKATIDPVVGGGFVAWDGYITGTTLELDPLGRVVQTWRTSNFTDDEDSTIEVLLEPVGNETQITVRHSSVPSEHMATRTADGRRATSTPCGRISRRPERRRGGAPPPVATQVPAHPSFDRSPSSTPKSRATCS